MKILAIIPARKNSKGVPGKNGFRLGGKTLVELAVECAKESGVCTDICISSDDAKLRDHPDACAIPRPPWLATDEATTEGVVQHALCYMWDDKGREYDAVMVLQPTSPLRTVEHLCSAASCLRAKHGAVISVTPSRETISKACQLHDDGSFDIPDGPSHRQAYGAWGYRDGVFYLVATEYASAGVLYPKNRIYWKTPEPCGISIDTEEDWDAVQRIWREQNEGK